nr:hypothetical protein [Anaerolineales bacterium]
MKLASHFRTQAVWVAGLLLGGALVVGVLMAADQALAGALVQTAPQADQPPAPAPLAITPFDQAAAATTAAAAIPGLSVQPFRPAFRMSLGGTPPTAGVSGQAKPDQPAAATGPKPAATSPGLDIQSLVEAQALDWTIVFSDDFDTWLFPTTWYTSWVTYTSGLDAQWKDVLTNTSPSGSYSAWPAAGGADGVDISTFPDAGYPNGVNSWMVQGPFDFSGKTDIYVGFNLWYETEPNFDWLFLCISVDGVYYDCNNYWSGSSGGWTYQSFYLTSYAGYSSVYIAWVFNSDPTIGGDAGFIGPYVDDIYIWDYTPAPPPPPDARGQLIENPSFETGDLTAWNTVSIAGLSGAALAPQAAGAAPRSSAAAASVTPLEVMAQSVAVTNSTYVDVAYSAWLGRDADGADYLYQPIFVSNTVTALTLNYWYAVTTNETNARSDFFCASLQAAGGVPNTVLVDLGCVDAVSATGYWQEVIFDLTPDQLAAVKGQTVDLVFELYNTTDPGQPILNTYAYVDYVWAYIADPGAYTSLDPHEPNNAPAEATALACSASILDGVIGDALGSPDEDWYVISAPAGPLTLDIDARTHVPVSALDATLTVYDAGLNFVAYNDDDGATYDSFLTYDVPSGATYYVVVRSLGGDGRADYTYDLTATCGTEVAPPVVGNVTPPAADTWNVMLFLNAEDQNFESILQGYLNALPAVVLGKQSFLTITVLYDGPGNTGLTRYVIQPTGTPYTDGVNRWALAEDNMGDAATLRDFVNWSMDLYPAENYYLAIDDHGDGIYGTSVDKTSNYDQLTPPEIYSALKDATHNGERKLSIFDYESCLMGLAENAYDLRQWVDYVVFSQQISWGISTYPVYFADLAAGDTPRTVGERIVARYSAGAVASQNPHTISLIDTSQMETVRATMDTLAAALATANPTTMLQTRSATQAFAANLQQATNPDFAEYLDLYDLAAQAAARGLVTSQAAGALQAAVDQAVVAER